MHGPPPPPGALSAFALPGSPVPLPGGRGTSWRAGDAVLKPLDMRPELLDWQAELLPRIERRRPAFRVAVPLRDGEGRLVAEGWTAWRHVEGRHRPEAWQEILSVCRNLHEAMRQEPAPPGLAERDDVWAVADRVAWGETDAAAVADAPHLERLLGARRAVAAAGQLIHADLAGNVLFAEGLAPAVIDLSPAWRPAPYAEAIALVDLAVDGGAPASAITAAAAAGRRQELVRALVFRIVAEHLGGADPVGVARRYQDVVDRVTAAPPVDPTRMEA